LCSENTALCFSPEVSGGKSCPEGISGSDQLFMSVGSRDQGHKSVGMWHGQHWQAVHMCTHT